MCSSDEIETVVKRTGAEHTVPVTLLNVFISEINVEFKLYPPL